MFISKTWFYPKLNKRSIFTTESVLPDECKHLHGKRCWWNLLMHSRLFKAPKTRSRHQHNNQCCQRITITFGYSGEIHESLLLTFTVFSTSLYRWNTSLLNLLYRGDQGIPLMARLTWICRSYSQQPKSTTHGRHIGSSKYVMYDSFFVNFFLVSRSFQFRVRKEKGGARRIWTKCKYHDVRNVISIPNWYFSFLNFSTNSICKYKRNEITKGTRVVTSLQGSICFPCCLRGVSLFLNTGCLEPFRSNQVQNYASGYVFLSAALWFSSPLWFTLNRFLLYIDKYKLLYATLTKKIMTDGENVQ